MIEIPATLVTIKPILELFNGSVSGLWVTTYNIDLTLFNEFLFGRLGDPPLNVNVLADYRRLLATLERIPSERADTITSVNSRWLLRGIRPSGQAFHPKAYLALIGTKALLLVGSGNLSSSGLNDGYEIFTSFLSGTSVGDSAIVIWRNWMQRIVEIIGDTMLAERFRKFNDCLPALLPPPTLMPLLHNLDLPIVDQFVSTIKSENLGSVDELFLAAPFYDADTKAVARLLSDFKPQRVSVYVTQKTSVNGVRLRERLVESGARINVQFCETDNLIHAKLIGVIIGSHGWLLSGSANLSEAALTRTAFNGGNVELAVLSRLEPDQIIATFVPPEMTIVNSGLDALNTLSFKSNEGEDFVLPPVHLITAISLSDGRVEILTNPPLQDGWQLDDLTEQQSLIIESSGRTVTVNQLSGRLVQVVDTEGKIISNRVVVDDPASLTRMLTANSGHSLGDKPSELQDSDLDTPLGRALALLNQKFIMDVTERLTKLPAGGVVAGENDRQTDDAFWQRVEREQLVRDSRVSTYGRIWARNQLTGTEPIMELIETLRNRTPKDSRACRVGNSILSYLLENEPSEDDKSESSSHRWKLSARIRVRTLNVLRRWANAQTDERLAWINPLAPAANFATIMEFLAGLQLERSRDGQQIELTAEDLNDLLFHWLRPFVGSGKADGWLDSLEPVTLSQVHERLKERISDVLAALCWLAVPPGSNRKIVIEWQPVIVSMMNHNLISPTESTARYICVVTGNTVNRTQVDDQILKIIEYVDNELWCERINSELGFSKLTLKKLSLGIPPTQLRLDVDGITDLFLDSRIPRLIVAVRNYSRCNTIAIFSADSTWRLVLTMGEKLKYLSGLNKLDIESVLPITDIVLEQLTRSGGVLATLFANTAVV